MKDQYIEMNMKENLRIKNITNKHRYCLKSNFVGVNKFFVLVYSNVDGNSRSYKARRYYLPNSVIKNYNVIINVKNFYDQPIVSDIKRYK